MILDLKRGYAFIHIPRTGGVSVSETIREACPDADVSLKEHRHQHACQVRLRLAPKDGPPGQAAAAWRRLKRFSTIRNPWQIVQSDYRLTLCHIARLNAEGPGWSDRWRGRVERLAATGPDFALFVAREYLTEEYSGIRPGGFWTTYCCDRQGRDLGVRPFYFAALPKRWAYICRWIGIPDCQLKHVNAAPAAPTPWTPELIAQIGDLCRGDVERFGFKPPKIGKEGEGVKR